MSIVQAKKGYILALVMILISLLTVIVSYMALRAQTFAPFASARPDQMKSRLLAYSGVQIAMAQLVGWSTVKKDEQVPNEPAKKPDPLQAKKQLLENLLPVLNQFQQFTLSKKVDGIDGELDICIGCEAGKINLNALWDFQKERFVFDDPAQKDQKKIYEDIFVKIGSLTKTTNLLSALENYFKTRGYLIDDPTQLLLVKEFQPFAKALFYDPSDGAKDAIYLTDIFTVWSGSPTIDPWVLSHSVAQLLDFKPAQVKNAAELAEMLKARMNWKADWDKALQPIYQKAFNTLPNSIDSLLTAQFEPKIFSVLVTAQVGKATSKMMAFLELENKTSGKNATIEIKIRKIYWL